jgi:hypothetical protein
LGWQREYLFAHTDNLLVSVLGLATKKRRSKTPWSQGTQEGRCEMEQNDESQEPTGTSASAKIVAMPAGDILLRWKWVERSVWTDRMLVALALTSWASGGWPEHQ